MSMFDSLVSTSFSVIPFGNFRIFLELLLLNSECNHYFLKENFIPCSNLNFSWKRVDVRAAKTGLSILQFTRVPLHMTQNSLYKERIQCQCIYDSPNLNDLRKNIHKVKERY